MDDEKEEKQEKRKKKRLNVIFEEGRQKTDLIR